MATKSLEPIAKVDPVKLRSWWWHRQGLDGRLGGSTSDAILAATGWARSVGGANPYLQLFSRGGISREQTDRDLAEQRIHELPSARGCTYVLPQSHYAIGLLVGQGQSDEAAISAAVRHLDVTEAEISGLMEGVQDALESGPLDPKALKGALGDRVRNLGDAGKKRGITTTLPLALGRLQSHGLIRRLPIGGRIDQQRYAYGLWRPSPLEGVSLTREQALEELARLYWQWCGPASLTHFQWFSGLGVGAAKEVVEALDLEPVAEGSDLLLLKELKQEWDEYIPPVKPHYSLIAGTDGLFLLHREVAALLDPGDIDRDVPSEQGMTQAGSISDLSCHAIVDRGRIVGLWEFDPDRSKLVTLSFIEPNPGLRDAVKRMEEYACDQLGDVRSFSLDSPSSRQPRIQALEDAKSPAA